MSKTPHTSWWNRLCEGSYRASTRRLVREIEAESPGVYSEMLQDLDTPLEPVFEREVARHLDRGGYRAFVPADTLMPAMLQRFGLESRPASNATSAIPACAATAMPARWPVTAGVPCAATPGLTSAAPSAPTRQPSRGWPTALLDSCQTLATPACRGELRSASPTQRHQPCLGGHAELGIGTLAVGLGGREGDVEFGGGGLEGMAAQQIQAELALALGKRG